MSVLTDCNRQASMMCRAHRKADAIRETIAKWERGRNLRRGKETSKGTEHLLRSRGVVLDCDTDYF